MYGTQYTRIGRATTHARPQGYPRLIVQSSSVHSGPQPMERFVMQMRPLLFSAAVSLLAVGAASAQQPQRPGGRGGRGAQPDTTPSVQPGAQRGARPGMPGARPNAEDSDTLGVPAIEKIVVTHHTTSINGKSISYTAHAGTMVLRDEDGKPKASVFFIAYTKDQEDLTTRPITFFYNGGPGSASIWLDMGIMSPMHPDMGPNGSQPAPPYNLVVNPNSPLDVTDLVQIDAMNTGYSRPAKGVKAADFTGTQNDIAMFGEFIRDYLDKYNRWQSPKYLFGESYGTFRSAGLAAHLQSAEGIELNGIMLLGTVLDLQYIAQSPTNDIAYSTFLPTYTATAWYHKRLPADLQSQTLQQVVQQSRDYAFGRCQLVALGECCHVRTERVVARLLHHLLQGLTLQIRGEPLVVPRRRCVRREERRVGDIVRWRLSDVLKIKHSSEKHDSVQLDALSRLQVRRQAGGTERSVALTEQILGRLPAIVLIEIVTDELTEHCDVVLRSGEVSCLDALGWTRVAGVHRVNLDEIGYVERGVGVHDQVVRRSGLGAIRAHVRMHRTHNAHVQPDGR